MTDRPLHPTQDDFLQTIHQNDRYIVDYTCVDGTLRVKTAGRKLPKGVQRIEQSPYFTRTNIRHHGTNSYGQDEYTILFAIDQRAFTEEQPAHDAQPQTDDHPLLNDLDGPVFDEPADSEEWQPR